MESNVSPDQIESDAGELSTTLAARSGSNQQQKLDVLEDSEFARLQVVAEDIIRNKMTLRKPNNRHNRDEHTFSLIIDYADSFR
jgi:hypothetical protein